MPEMSPLEELAQLKESVALFRGAQAQAQAVEPELREKRDALIAAPAGCFPERGKSVTACSRIAACGTCPARRRKNSLPSGCAGS
jgi:hypothetical protein